MKATIDAERAEELYMMNLNDREIADALGVSHAVVYRWRKREDLPPNYTHPNSRKYRVFDFSGRIPVFLMEGTAKECAAYLNVTVSCVYKLYCKTRDKQVTRCHRIFRVGDLVES